MSDRWGRLASLTGLLFTVLLVVGMFNGSETPAAKDPAAKIVRYYAAHESRVKVSALLFSLAFLVLILFAGALRAYLRRTARAEAASALLVPAAVLMAAGVTVGSGVEFGLANEIHHFGPETVKTLEFLNEEVVFLPLIGGGFVFGLCSGIAILRGAALPRWLGWVAVVIGVAALIPPASFPALLALGLWTAISSVLVYRRSGAPRVSAEAPPTPTPAAAPAT